MKYLDDMLSKWGFGDGEAIPDGVECYREVYLKAINAMAERLGTKQRAVPFDRSGMHNWCMIAFAPGEDQPIDWEHGPDELMQKAIRICSIADWDSWVCITPEVYPDFEKSLTEMLNACIQQSGEVSACDVCGANVPHIIGCPDGSEICQDCFDAGTH